MCKLAQWRFDCGKILRNYFDIPLACDWHVQKTNKAIGIISMLAMSNGGLQLCHLLFTCVRVYLLVNKKEYKCCLLSYL